MTDIAKIDTVYIPNVRSQALTPELICDESETAGRKLMRDVSRLRRRWKLTAFKLTPTEKNAILDLLAAKTYGAVQFWLDEFGAEDNTVLAYVTVDNVERQTFGKSGVWYESGASIELTIVEQ